MKKSITILGIMLFVSVIFTGCGGKDSPESAEQAVTTEETAPKQEETTTSEAPSEEKVSESKSDCDEFIKDYEEFVNDYISIIKKMKANPTDMTIMGEYTDMATKAASMQSDAKNCTDPKYASQIAKLGMKMANAAAAGM
jgi:hypothetical protein